MAVEDRVAFALMFLSDNKLYEYLKKLTQKLTEEGNLAGFLLTGLFTSIISLYFGNSLYFYNFSKIIEKLYLSIHLYFRC